MPPFKYVTADDLRAADNAMTLEGVSKDDKIARLRSLATEIEYQKSKEQGPGLFLKSLMTGAANVPADMLSGLSALTPAGSAANTSLQNAASGIRSTIDPNWQRQVGEAAGGSLKSMETWEANIGAMIPMIAELALVQKFGGKVGGKIGGVVAPAAGFGSMSAGGFLEQAKSYGIDEDIARRKAVLVGGLNSMLGEIGFLAGSGATPYDPQKIPAAKKLLQELGVTALGGIAIAGTEEINAKALDLASGEMKQRHPDWEPSQKITPPDPLRALALGLGPIGAIRIAAHTASQMSPKALQERIYKHTEDVKAEGKSYEEFFRTGKLEHPKETVSLEPMGWQAQMEIGKSKITQAQLREDLARAPEARIARIAENLGITTTPSTTPEDIRKLVIAQIGQVKEGPTLTKDGAISSKILNMAHADEVDWGRRVDDAAREYFNTGMEPKQIEAMTQQRIASLGLPNVTPTAVKLVRDAIAKNYLTNRQRELYGLREQALLDAGLSKELSIHPQLNPVDGSKPNTSLPHLLTRDQFLKYSDSLKGQLESSFRKDIGNEIAARMMVNDLDPRLFSNLTNPEPIIDPKTGKDITGIDYTDAPTFMMSLSKLMPHPIQQMILDAATGTRTLEPFRVLTQRLREARHTQDKIGKFRLNAWLEDVPKAFSVGTGRARMHDLVAYLRIKDGNAKEAENLRKQLGVEKENIPERALAQRVIDESKVNSKEILPHLLGRVSAKKYAPEEILGMATKIAGKERMLSDWFVRNGFIEWDQYRDSYMPWVKKYWTRKGANMKEWEQYRDTVMHQGLRDAGFSEKRIAEMKSVHDLMGRFSQRGIKIPESDPFFQYLRKADEDSLALIARETDQDVLNDMYTRQALRNFYFDDIAPGLAAYMKNIEGSLLLAQEKNQRLGTTLNIPYDGVMQMMSDVFESILDITPDRATKAWNKYNILSNNNIASRFLKRGADTWNKHLGFMHEIPEFVSFSDALSGLISFEYVKSLGLPLHFMSPIKNIMTQLPAASVFGDEAFFRGMARAVKGVDKEYFKKLGITSEEYIPIHGRSAFVSGMRNIGEISLGMFKASENGLRMTGAGAAMECWERLEPILKKDPTLKNVSLDEFSKVLLRNKKISDMGVPERSLMENMPLAQRYMQDFTKGVGQITEKTSPRGFRGMTNVMYELIRKGKPEEAKDFFVTMGAELPNWRYGKGGGINLFRNPVVKVMTMFSRWPINYVMFHSWLMNPKNGLIRREFQMMSSMFLLAGLASSLGMTKNAVKWVGLGPVPEEVGFGGPIYDELIKLWKVIMGGAEVATAEAVATPEERDKVMRRFKQSWTSLERGW